MDFSALNIVFNPVSAKKFKDCPKQRYEDIKDQLQTGDLLFCSGSYPVSQMIKMFSNSLFSHVGFIVCWNGRHLLFESVETDGVRIVPLEHYASNYENSRQKYKGELYIARHQEFASLKPEKLDRIVQKGIDLLNSGYDKEQIAAIAARIALKIGRNEEDNEYICSEFIAKCFSEGDIHIPLNADGFWYPEDIAVLDAVKPQYELIG